MISFNSFFTNIIEMFAACTYLHSPSYYNILLDDYDNISDSKFEDTISDEDIELGYTSISNNRIIHISNIMD